MSEEAGRNTIDASAGGSATSYITASDETTLTLGNGLDNDSAKPDGDWQDHQAKFVFTRGSNSSSLTFTFVNA